MIVGFMKRTAGQIDMGKAYSTVWLLDCWVSSSSPPPCSETLLNSVSLRSRLLLNDISILTILLQQSNWIQSGGMWGLGYAAELTAEILRYSERFSKRVTIFREWGGHALGGACSPVSCSDVSLGRWPPQGRPRGRPGVIRVAPRGIRGRSRRRVPKWGARGARRTILVVAGNFDRKKRSPEKVKVILTNRWRNLH